MIKKRNLQAFSRSKWYVHTLFGSRDRAIRIQKFEQSCIPNYSPFALFWASYMNETLTAPGFPYEGTKIQKNTKIADFFVFFRGGGGQMPPHAPPPLGAATKHYSPGEACRQEKGTQQGQSSR